MNNLSRFLALATLAALPIVGRAQVTYTNINSSLTPVTLGSSAYTAIQTFDATGFSSLSSMTWSVNNATGNASSQATFNAYVVEWSGSTAVVGTLQAFGTGQTVTGINASQNVNLIFNGSWTAANPTSTYALLLSFSSGDSVFAANLGTNPSNAFFSTGGAGAANFSVGGAGSQANFQTLLQAVGTAGGVAIDTNNAYTMSVTSGIAPAPEPKTAAAGIAALFVAALVGRRTWQRRKLAAELLAA